MAAGPGDAIVRVDADGPVATVTLNRPDKKNALSIALRDAVSDALDALAEADEIRTVVFTGEGGVFSAGFDLGEFADPSPEHQARLWASSDRFHHAVLQFPLPTIAAIDGPALAGGFDLACLTDIRIASTRARFAHPEQQWAPVVYRPLLHLVGASAANDLAFTGRSIDANEALRLGLVSEVVAPDRLAALARERADQIAAAPRDVLVAMKAKAIEARAIDPTTPTLGL